MAEKDPQDMTVDELKQELTAAAVDTAEMELDNLINVSQKKVCNDK